MNRWLLFFCIIALIFSSALAGILDVFEQAEADLWNFRWEEGVGHFRQAAELDRNHPLAAVALFNAANVELLVNNDADKALDLFQQVIARNPESVWAAESYRRIAEIVESQGKSREAADYYGQALAAGAAHQQQLTDAWLTEISMAAAAILTDIGDIEATIALYSDLHNKITEGEPAAQVRFGLAQAFETKGDLREAGSYYREVANYYPYTQSARALQSKRQLMIDQLSYDWSAFDLLQQSQAQLRAGNRSQAATFCQQLAEEYPESPLLPWAQLVIISTDVYSGGDFRKGIADATNLLLDNPGFPGNYAVRITVERWEALARLVDDAKDNPEDMELYTTIGYQLMGARAMELAQYYFNYVLERNPEDPTANLGLGNSLLATGHTDEAIPHFEAYLKANPNDGITFNQLGYAFLGVRQFDQAREMFLRYIEVDTTEANAFDSMGECLYNEGKYAESIAHYKKALQLDPTFGNSQFMLGEVYKASGDTTNAIDAYRHYLEMDSGGSRLAQLARTNLDSLRMTITE
jgi:tetratricopeptide (TPR) repeat protein